MDANLSLIKLTFIGGQVSFELSIWVIVALVTILVITKKYRLVKVHIKLGGVGNAEFAPNEEDIQIAHQLWTELITRKAAIEIIPDEDIIVEVYDSWYELFKKTRELIAAIPAYSVQVQSTKELIRISTETLNEGLRPHLTKWQAKYKEENLKEMSPQELQRKYPEYDELMEDMKRVNIELIEYASQLKKIVQAEQI
jgi:hypothetical protein